LQLLKVNILTGNSFLSSTAVHGDYLAALLTAYLNYAFVNISCLTKGNGERELCNVEQGGFKIVLM
jgi:hypothetical protein